MVGEGDEGRVVAGRRPEEQGMQGLSVAVEVGVGVGDGSISSNCPILLVACSVNQIAPSGPTVIAVGLLVMEADRATG